ncbi:hypothetical protein FRB94_004158 [Tulasnella sp. JGI-2019a]|nr:hypothetical protein FRB94_004158 [Tulasnella sp. JGI-2019a]KAG9037294.1 hypothetical protein FRB95_006237 [Tulasnella sp. JGI-2019a]
MIFAFGPNQSYYFNNGDGKAYWENLPEKLEKLLKEEKHYVAKHVKCLNLFPNGGWYIQGEKDHDSYDIPEKINAAIIANYGTKATITNIEVDATNIDRFYIGTTHTDTIYAHDMPHDCLMTALAMGPRGGFSKVSLGHNGTWVLIGPALNNYNISDEMTKYMRKDPDHIVNVVLSPYDSQHGFIEYHNGNFDAFLPEQWHAHVDELKHSKTSIFLHSVAQNEIFQAVVAGLAKKAEGNIKSDIKSAFAK